MVDGSKSFAKSGLSLANAVRIIKRAVLKVYPATKAACNSCAININQALKPKSQGNLPVIKAQVAKPKALVPPVPVAPSPSGGQGPATGQRPPSREGIALRSSSLFPFNEGESLSLGAHYCPFVFLRRLRLAARDLHQRAGREVPQSDRQQPNAAHSHAGEQQSPGAAAAHSQRSEPSPLAKNMALDVLNWICFVRLNRFRSPKSERLKDQINKQTAANIQDLLAQQFECISSPRSTLNNCCATASSTASGVLRISV